MIVVMVTVLGFVAWQRVINFVPIRRLFSNFTLEFYNYDKRIRRRLIVASATGTNNHWSRTRATANERWRVPRVPLGYRWHRCRSPFFFKKVHEPPQCGPAE